MICKYLDISKYQSKDFIYTLFMYFILYGLGLYSIIVLVSLITKGILIYISYCLLHINI